MIHHLLCYQGLAVGDYSFAPDALDLEYPRLSQLRSMYELFSLLDRI